jgi:hypothetical protein
LEIEDDGGQAPVHVTPRDDVRTGGIIQIRQGHSRRIAIELLQTRGEPLHIQHVNSVQIGDVRLCDKNSSRAVISASEGDIETVRDQASDVLMKVRESIMQQVSADDPKVSEYSRHITRVTAERDAICAPEPYSGLPGTFTEVPPEGFESQVSVIYFPIGEDQQDLLPNSRPVDNRWSDHQADFLRLHIITQQSSPGVLTVTCAWDATAHDQPELVCLTADQNRVFVRLQLICQVEGAESELIINKYLCFKVLRHSFSFKPRWFEFISPAKYLLKCGLRLQIVTGVPSRASDVEDKTEDSVAADFLRAKESFGRLLHIDRIKQDMALEELLSSPTSLKPRMPVSSAASLRHLYGSDSDLDQLHEKAGRLESMIQRAENSGNSDEARRLRKEYDGVMAARNAKLDAEWVKVGTASDDDQSINSSSIPLPEGLPGPTMTPGVNLNLSAYDMYAERIRTGQSDDDLRRLLNRVKDAFAAREISAEDLNDLQERCRMRIEKLQQVHLSRLDSRLGWQAEQRGSSDRGNSGGGGGGYNSSEGRSPSSTAASLEALAAGIKQATMPSTPSPLGKSVSSSATSARAPTTPATVTSTPKAGTPATATSTPASSTQPPPSAKGPPS